MVRAIAAEGHELACHSDRHVPLDRVDPASFRDGLRRNRDALYALDPELHRRPSSQLNACRFLTGDRVTAAEAMNRSEAFRILSADEAPERLWGAFADAAVIQWSDRRAEGRNAAVALRSEQLAGSSGLTLLMHEVVEGLNVDEARLVGVLVRPVDWPDGRFDYENARVELLWRRDPSRELRVSRTIVGPWIAIRQAR